MVHYRKSDNTATLTGTIIGGLLLSGALRVAGPAPARADDGRTILHTYSYWKRHVTFRSGKVAPKKGQPAEPEKKEVKDVKIDVGGLESRLYELPVRGGNYRNLSLSKTHLYYQDYVGVLRNQRGYLNP